MITPDPWDTDPDTFITNSQESWLLGFDTKNYLNGGTLSSSGPFALFDATEQVAVTLTDAPTTAGNVVTQMVRKTQVSPGHFYTLTLPLVTSQGNKPIMVLKIEVPE